MEPNNQNPVSMKDRLLQKIESHEISMRPKFYFTLKVVALVVVSLAVLCISIFIFNFILFGLRLSGHEALLGFGTRGVEVFIQLFPWWLLLLDIALIVALERLVREFRFGYKIPVLYLLLAIVGLTGATALAIDRGTYVNDSLLDSAEHQRLPAPLSGVYGHARRPPPLEEGTCVCVITSINGATLILQDTGAGSTLTVVLPSNDPRATTTGLQVGDTIFLAGDLDNGVIHAFGVKRYQH